MTKDQWQNCTNPRTMLEFLGQKPRSRKLRLFAVACCYRVRNLLTGKHSWKAVKIAEKQAEVGEKYQVEFGLDEELAKATESLEIVPPPDQPYPNAPAYYATWQHSLDAAVSTSIATLEAIHNAGGNPHEELTIQVADIRDIFGNPFRPITADPTWLTEAVVGLATGIYTDRAFERMPILADALQDAGCTNAEILNHCREPRLHVRGCWVVDLILGKE